MAFLQKYWAQIREFFAHLTVTEKWLIGSLTAIFVLVGFIALQYAASPELVPISPFAADREGDVLTRLKAEGIAVVSRNGQILVPADKQLDALVILQRGDLLTTNTSSAFDQMITRQSPWMTNAQNAQMFLLAKQKVLGMVIGKMSGVRGSDVMLSLPEDRGFGRSHVRPSASVNIVMQGNKRIEKALVGAVAGLISGAVAGMSPQDVVVIDALAGRQFTVKSAQDQLPGETLEFVQAMEQYHRDKIADLLGYIPGVIVAVNVLTDPSRSKQIEEVVYEKSEPIRSEFSKESERSDGKQAGAPGVRSNNGLDVEGGGGGASSMEKVGEIRTEYGAKQPTRKISAIEAGHTVQQINVTINIPRSYFINVYKVSKGSGGGDPANPDTPPQEPDENAIQPIVSAQIAQIEAQVAPLVNSSMAQGIVKASMIPDRAMLMAVAAGPGAAVGMSAGFAGMIESNWARPAGLSLLALLSLAIMFFMVRKATKAMPLPSIEELAGVPPTLPSDDDMVGEAEASETTMTGVELTEEEIRHRRTVEQITDLIKNNPNEATLLIKRWVRTDG